MPRAKRQAPPPAPPAPTYPMSVETFRDFGASDLRNIAEPQPSCFNGWVRVRKYRVTVELIEEPTEVVHQRLIDLWDHCTNHHHAEPLKATAARYGLTLPGTFGSKVPKRW